MLNYKIFQHLIVLIGDLEYINTPSYNVAKILRSHFKNPRLIFIALTQKYLKKDVNCLTEYSSFNILF